MTLVFKELARNSIGEGNLGFSIDMVDGETNLRIDSPTAAKLEALVTKLIGGVDFKPIPNNGQSIAYGGIRRSLPMRHAWSRNLFITAIKGLRGVGRHTAEVSEQDIFVPVLSGYPLYSNYECQVQFTAPDYEIKPNSEIKTIRSQYYNANGQLVSFNYSNEWIRYLEWKEISDPQVLSSKYGSMYAETSDDAAPGGPAATLTGARYQGTPFQIMPNSIIKMKWHRVPLSFLTSPNSFIRNMPIGTINQYDWFDPKGDGRPMFKRATLRYDGYTHTHYSPPVRASNGDMFGFQFGLATDKLCDIEFTFARTNRDRFAERLPTHAQANLNWLVGGWNLLPWPRIPNRYFFWHWVDETDAVTRLDQTKWFPSHNSAPLELLFTNPDAPQPERNNMLEFKPET